MSRTISAADHLSLGGAGPLEREWFARQVALPWSSAVGALEGLFGASRVVAEKSHFGSPGNFGGVAVASVAGLLTPEGSA